MRGPVEDPDEQVPAEFVGTEPERAPGPAGGPVSEYPGIRELLGGPVPGERGEGGRRLATPAMTGSTAPLATAALSRRSRHQVSRHWLRASTRPDRFGLGPLCLKLKVGEAHPSLPCPVRCVARTSGDGGLEC